MVLTSLASQLKQLEAPQTSLLVHKTKKASFLFSEKEAANFDRDTIFELGKVFLLFFMSNIKTSIIDNIGILILVV